MNVRPVAEEDAKANSPDGSPRLTDDELIDECSRDSFPASDAPSFWGGGRSG